MRTSAIIFLLGIFFGYGVVSVSAQVIETVNLPAVQKTGGMSLMEALQNRQSQRSFSSKELSLQQMSNLLWAAYGINRPNGYRTVPSARSYNEFDIYIIKAEGWLVYDPEKHTMLKMGNEDLREHAGTQPFVKTAPVNLVFVADFDRMTNSDEEFRKFYSATDVGYISQNIYLWCASEGLATIVRGQIDKVKAKEVLKLRPNQHVILAQTVGYPGE
ncbi:MAG: SagB/ThcOx family dehydrogenase [Flavobacteriaceae bacterium]|nr:SagB/ThcOx family dehydrogenase [Flavobacteriaceae bacterium]